jgi:Fic family protein
VIDELKHLVAQVGLAANLNPLAIATAAMLHCLVVHPFSDGNGRLSFLLFQYSLFRSGVLTHPLVPLGPFLEKHRSEYLDALIRFAVDDTMVPFCTLVERAAEATAIASEEALTEFV